MSRWKMPLLVLLLVCGAAAIGFWFGRDSQPDQSPAETKTEESSSVPAVQTQRVVFGSITQTYEAYGSVQPAAGSLANVSAQFDARIIRVLVSPGEPVSTETAVAEIGPTAEAQLQFKQSQDTLAAAESSLAQARQRLSEQLATNADVSTFEQAQRAAKTQLDNLTQRGIQASQTITAGLAGVVTQISAQAGQVVQAGTSILLINAQGNNEAVVGVEPETASLLHVGDKAELNDVHLSDEAPPIAGTIRRIGQQINAQTRLRDVVLSLPLDSSLPPGSFVIAHLSTATAKGLVVPRSAVFPDDEDQVVYSIVDGKAKRHAIQVGLKIREQVQIVSEDLLAGDAIVTIGNAELEDGMAVQVNSAATELSTSTTSPSAEDK